MTCKDFQDMGNCYRCEWFNPYTIEECSSGECWRFPEHKKIDRPCGYQCAEYQSARFRMKRRKNDRRNNRDF